MKHDRSNDKTAMTKTYGGGRADYRYDDDEDDWRENRKKRSDQNRRQSRRDKYRDQD